ncbi:12730_t:CDS:2, partial [Funneliformis geosporum]
MQSTIFRLRKDCLNQARNILLASQEEKIDANKDMKPIIINHLNPTSTYSTLIIEVGRIETIPSLHGLSTGNAHTILPTYKSNNTVPDIISFGTAPLHYNTIDFLTNSVGIPIANITGFRFSTTAYNASGIPNYQLHIPAIELFNGSLSGIPAGTINGFYLNLWELQ